MPTTLHQADAYNLGPNTAQLPERGSTTTLLEERARQLGSSLGRVVATLRKTQTRLRDAATHATDAAVAQYQGVRRQIKAGYKGTKDGTQKVLHEYPVHVVLAAGALGLLLGVSLRIWRASHES